jgi:D-alanyl-D-alanine dipeptidase
VIYGIGGHLTGGRGVLDAVVRGGVRLLKPVQGRGIVVPLVVGAGDLNAKPAASFPAGNLFGVYLASVAVRFTGPGQVGRYGYRVAGALDRLVRAQGFLPDGYRLQVKEAWRPIWVQERLWEMSLGQLRGSRPGLADEELRTENARFTAPPDSAPPHSTGGTVDLVLRKDGEPVDLGWGFNQPGAGSRTAHPVGDDARRGRDILGQAMDAAGFINYPQEWWHWSYGDRYWAFQTSAEATLYGPR